MSNPSVPQVHDSIRSLQPYKSGKPIEAVRREFNIDSEIIKLASNENPLGASSKVVRVLNEYQAFNYYPDSSGYILKQAIANKYRLNQEQLTLGNGSDNLINLLAQAYLPAQSHAIVCQYGFLPYKIAALGVEAKVTAVASINWCCNLQGMVSAIDDMTRMIMIANPNNPTGTWLTHDAIAQFMQQVPSRIIVLLDEAYLEYIEDDPLYHNSLALLKQYRNLVVLRTFSKIYGLAGLRVGYSISDPEIADYLNRIRLPFNVSTPALLAATEALSDNQHVLASKQQNQQGMAILKDFCGSVGLSYIPSAANFLTIDFQGKAGLICQQLLKQGIIVRSLHPYRMSNHLRISIGTNAQLQRLTDCLIKLI